MSGRWASHVAKRTQKVDREDTNFNKEDAKDLKRRKDYLQNIVYITRTRRIKYNAKLLNVQCRDVLKSTKYDNFLKTANETLFLFFDFCVILFKDFRLHHCNIPNEIRKALASGSETD